jgi:hypothetical protein
MLKCVHIPLLVVLCFACGCIRTGKLGMPVGERYKEQLSKVVIGETTPTELQKIFHGHTINKIEPMGTDDETWRLVKEGSSDPGMFLMFGIVARDKDQALLFHFNSGVLAGYESEILPDYDEHKVAKGKVSEQKLAEGKGSEQPAKTNQYWWAEPTPMAGTVYAPAKAGSGGK